VVFSAFTLTLFLKETQPLELVPSLSLTLKAGLGWGEGWRRWGWGAGVVERGWQVGWRRWGWRGCGVSVVGKKSLFFQKDSVLKTKKLVSQLKKLFFFVK
jgi:hypothetical protein